MTLASRSRGQRNRLELRSRVSESLCAYALSMGVFIKNAVYP